MYDYETIKKNFEKIKAKEILTYKQMFAKLYTNQMIRVIIGSTLVEVTSYRSICYKWAW